MEAMAGKTSGTGHTEMGIKTHNIETATYYAIRQAYDYIIQARERGAQIRTWVLEASQHIDNLIRWAENFQMGGMAQGTSKKEVERKISELGLQESKILRVVHHYLNETHLFKNKLQLLDPPLKSYQLEPFQEALAEDRKRTIAALEVLASHLQTLTRLKIEIIRDFQRLFAD